METEADREFQAAFEEFHKEGRELAAKWYERLSKFTTMEGLSDDFKLMALSMVVAMKNEFKGYMKEAAQ